MDPFVMAQQGLPTSDQSVCAAINKLKIDLIAHFDNSMNGIQVSLDALKGSLTTLNEHVDELETRVGTNEDNVTDLTERVKTLEKKCTYLEEKAEDQENRSRSQNLRFVNVPEKAEGRDMLDFMAKMIPHLLGAENFPRAPAIERAHRSPSALHMDPTKGPRPILVRFLSFQDKLRISRLAREKGSLTFQGQRVHIYPDLSAATADKRKQFDKVKKKLRDLDLKYSFVHPASLKVIVNGKASVYGNPAGVEAFLRDYASHK